MSPVAGPLFAAAILLGIAGVLKLARPDATRVALRTAGLPGRAAVARSIGLGEVGVALYVLVAGGRWAAALLTCAYLGFAAFSALVVARSKGQAPCGCFGASDTPLTKLHVWVDVGIAAVGAIGVVVGLPGIASVAGDTPLAGVPFVGFTIILAWLVLVLLTALPALQAAGRPSGSVSR